MPKEKAIISEELKERVKDYGYKKMASKLSISYTDLGRKVNGFAVVSSVDLAIIENILKEEKL